MNNKADQSKKISPILEKKNDVENKLKEDKTTEILANAIKSILNSNKN